MTALFALALQASCAHAPSATYDVTLDPTSEGRLQIGLEVRGVPRDSLVLAAFAPATVLDLSHLSAARTSGEPIRTNLSFRRVLAQGQRIDLPRIVLRGPLPSRVRVHYSVAPTKREGNDHTGFSGVSFGEVTPRRAFFVGRNVFLLPEPSVNVRRIVVRFHAAKGWLGAAPWMRVGSEWRPGVNGHFASEDLIASSVGIGRFRERSFRLGRTSFRFLVEASVDRETERLTLLRLRRVVRYVHGLFGRDLGGTYTTVLMPRSQCGDDLVGEGWASGQGGTLAPPTTSRVHRFAERLIDAYLVHAPYRAELRRPEEYWIADGTRRLYAWRAVSSSGLTTQDDVVRQAIQSYLMISGSEGLTQNLEDLGDPDRGAQFSRDFVAPVALVSLDYAVRRVTSERESLDDVIRRIYGTKVAGSLWAALPHSADPLWHRFRDKQVRGGHPLLIEALPRQISTQPANSLPGGSPTCSLTIAYTGDSDGLLENCGCKVNQSGGVARRATVIRRIRRQDPSLLLLDAGNSFPSPQAGRAPTFLELREQELYLSTMDLMRYDAAAVGSQELAFGTNAFRSMVRRLRTPFLSCNATEDGVPLAAHTLEVTRGGLRIGIVGVIDPHRGRQANRVFEDATQGLRFEDPILALRAAADCLRPRTDLRIAIGDIAPETIRRVVDSGIAIDIVISSSFESPTLVRTSSETSVELRDQPGFIGRTLVLYTTQRHFGWNFARVVLDAEHRIVGATQHSQGLGSDVADDPELRNVLQQFYSRVGGSEAAQRSVRPLFTWDSSRQHRRYAGAMACRSCHEDEYAQWSGTPHAAAFKTLLDRHRHYQPACISCHVVGFGTRHGYRVGDREWPLGNVQCEVCHGPGDEHVREPLATNITREVPRRVCLECHTPDHSDQFDYAAKVPMVRHGLDSGGGAAARARPGSRPPGTLGNRVEGLRRKT
jgi:hypothetical protein